MSFRSKSERFAYVRGILKGMRGGKPYGKRREKNNSPQKGAYNRLGKVSENRVDDRHGSVVFWDGKLPF